MKLKEVFFNKYSKAAALGGAATSIIVGMQSKTPTNIIARNALYVAISGLLAGSILRTIMEGDE